MSRCWRRRLSSSEILYGFVPRNTFVASSAISILRSVGSLAAENNYALPQLFYAPVVVVVVLLDDPVGPQANPVGEIHNSNGALIAMAHGFIIRSFLIFGWPPAALGGGRWVLGAPMVGILPRNVEINDAGTKSIVLATRADLRESFAQ